MVNSGDLDVFESDWFQTFAPELREFGFTEMLLTNSTCATTPRLWLCAFSGDCRRCRLGVDRHWCVYFVQRPLQTSLNATTLFFITQVISSRRRRPREMKPPLASSSSARLTDEIFIFERRIWLGASVYPPAPPRVFPLLFSPPLFIIQNTAILTTTLPFPQLFRSHHSSLRISDLTGPLPPRPGSRSTRDPSRGS
jgi:hypothetical protein